MNNLMRAKLELWDILNPEDKKTIIFENYDEIFMPPRPKGELSYIQMFEYWSKLIKEEYGDYIPASNFEAVGLIYNIEKI